MGKGVQRIETEADVAVGFARLVEIEPRFAGVAAPLPLRRRPDGFGTLLQAIVGQQVSTASAAAIWGRLEAAGLVEAAAVRRAGDADLVACGLSRTKLRYARTLAEFDLDFDALRVLPSEDAIAALVAVPGIGRWTAEVYALSALGHADVFPAGDLALQEGAKLLLDLPGRPVERDMRTLADAWSPVRAIAARALWAYYRMRTKREGAL